MAKLTHNTDEMLMVMAAHRYCLGRASYIVGSCIDWLDKHWGQIDQNTRYRIIKETKEAIENGHSGMDIDTKAWSRFIERHETNP